MVSAGNSSVNAVQDDSGPGDVVVKYIGQKISKIRWMPSFHGHLKPSNAFATGGWDDKDNCLSLWSLDDTQSKDETASLASEEPQLICHCPHPGNVTQMQFIDPSRLITASSHGSLQMYNFNHQMKSVSIMERWKGLHCVRGNVPCSCTTLAINFPRVYTSGEDGRLVTIDLESGKIAGAIECADSTTIFGLCCIGVNEVVSVSMCGNVKLWDVRSSSKSPEKCMTVSGEKAPLLSVDNHPNQSHVLVTGAGDGVVGIWDLRQETCPVQLMEAHKSEVWEVKFHPLKADNLFTCSEDGSAWYWDGSSLTSKLDRHGTSRSMGPSANKDSTSLSCAWMYIDANKHRLQTFSLIPFNRLSVNSIDIENNTLLCGTDGEAVICIKDIPTC